MVERIGKVDSQKYWAIDQKDRSQDDTRDDRGSGQNQRDFDEFSDFTKLIQKNPTSYVYEEIERKQVDKFFFRGVSTQGSHATLEVDIQFADGSVERGIRIAVGRDEGMGFLGKRLGETLAIEQIFKGSELLTIGLFRPNIIPTGPVLNSKTPFFKTWRKIKVYQVQIGTLFLVIGVLVFFLLKILSA